MWLKSVYFSLSLVHQLHLIMSESSVKLREIFPRWLDCAVSSRLGLIPLQGSSLRLICHSPGNIRSELQASPQSLLDLITSVERGVCRLLHHWSPLQRGYNIWMWQHRLTVVMLMFCCSKSFSWSRAWNNTRFSKATNQNVNKSTKNNGVCPSYIKPDGTTLSPGNYICMFLCK